jgi:hypothetical protein
MSLSIPNDLMGPRPNWSWISPDGTTYPIDIAYRETHLHWAKKNLKNLDTYAELENGSPDLERLFNSGWIRRSGEIFQTSFSNAHKAKSYIDKYEAKNKYFTIVAMIKDNIYCGIGTVPDQDLDSCGGWNRINEI